MVKKTWLDGEMKMLINGREEGKEYRDKLMTLSEVIIVSDLEELDSLIQFLEEIKEENEKFIEQERKENESEDAEVETLYDHYQFWREKRGKKWDKKWSDIIICTQY